MGHLSIVLHLPYDRLAMIGSIAKIAAKGLGILVLLVGCHQAQPHPSFTASERMEVRQKIGFFLGTPRTERQVLLFLSPRCAACQQKLLGLGDSLALQQVDSLLAQHNLQLRIVPMTLRGSRQELVENSQVICATRDSSLFAQRPDGGQRGVQALQYLIAPQQHPAVGDAGDCQQRAGLLLAVQSDAATSVEGVTRVPAYVGAPDDVSEVQRILAYGK